MRIIALAASLVLVTACTGNDNAFNQRNSVVVPELDWSQSRESDYGDTYKELEATVEMKGALPQVGTLDNGDGYGTVSMDSWEGSRWMNLTLNTLNEEGWGMIGLGLDIDPETGEADYYTQDIIGCSGPEEFNADFDEAPNEGELTVETIQIDGEDFVKFELVGEFRGDNEVIGVAVVPAAPSPSGE